MKINNKTSKMAIRLEPKEKQLLFYYATKMGISPSALVRNQIKSMLHELEDRVYESHFANITKLNSVTGPTFTQDEIEEIFAVEK